MCRKYIVDSVRYWAEEYKLDGFRFDLMALHDVETMQAVEEAVHAVNPRALIYGEGWTGGTSPLHDNFRASQANIKNIAASGDGIGAVAVFNARLAGRYGRSQQIFPDRRARDRLLAVQP